MKELRLKHVWVVFKKEVKDIIRDRRTIVMSIFVPMILIPLLNILVGGGAEKLQKDINENVIIALSKDSNTEAVKDLVRSKIIKGRPNIRLIDVNDPIDSIRKEEVRLVLDIDSDYAQKLKEGKPFDIRIMYDKSKAKSEGSLQILEEAIEDFNNRIVRERLVEIGIDLDILRPSTIRVQNVGDPKYGGNVVLMTVLPLMIGLLVVVGGIPAATDLVAGEKERNTLEPLLTTRADRVSILLGKYLAVTLFSFVSVAAIITGFVVTYILNPNAFTLGFDERVIEVNIQPFAMAFIVLISVAMGMTFAGIEIALSTFARSFKEAQTYLSFLVFAAMIPGYATMFMQPNDISWYLFLVPVLNTISSIKMILGGTIDYNYLIMALISSVVYIVGTISLATFMFNSERALFRS